MRRAAVTLLACSMLMATVKAQGREQERLAERCGERRPERSPVTLAVLDAVAIKGDREARMALEAIGGSTMIAAAAAPLDVNAQYDLAVVLGARADREGGRRKIATAVELQAQARRVIALAPDHPGAHYLLARLYAAVRRVDGFTRFMASHLLGGKTLVNHPWPEIQSLFEVAERGAPCELEYHFELAQLHRERGAHGEAAIELRHVLELYDHGEPRWVAMRRQAETILAVGKRRLP